MYYEEQVVNGVLCWRGAPDGELQPMSAERLTALVLELRQRQVAAPVIVPQPYPVVAPQPYPVVAPQPTWVPHQPWQPPWTITCGGAR